MNNVEVKLTPSGLTSSTTTYYVSSFNFLLFKYGVFCLTACPWTHLVYYTIAPASSYTCILCTLINCKTCETPTFCYACQPGFTLYPNKTCSTCLTDCLTCNSNTTCSTCLVGLPVIGGCTVLSYCIEVDPGSTQINRCVKCQNTSNLRVVSGLCMNILGCSAAILTS